MPVDHFIPQPMRHIGFACYAALLTAGRYRGAAHKQPLVFRVVVAQKRQPITCGEVRVCFVARRNANRWRLLANVQVEPDL